MKENHVNQFVDGTGNSGCLKLIDSMVSENSAPRARAEGSQLKVEASSIGDQRLQKYGETPSTETMGLAAPASIT